MKEKLVYVCSECGQKAAKWSGKCPSCGGWNTMEEQIETVVKGKSAQRSKSAAAPNRLCQVENKQKNRYHTSMGEFDRVMGGGIVPDSLTILASPPGGGKSTLALMVAADLAKQGKTVLYASGEESESQIKSRADRILDGIDPKIWIVSDTCLNRVLETVPETDPDLLVIDSIQTFFMEEYFPSRAGTPTQTMECAGALAALAKSSVRPRAVILIGQMNKNDELAGLRALEHLVDTVLIMEGENAEELRSIMATKNRFGSTGEMGFFSMTEKGLVSIDNPSAYFVTERPFGERVSGSALTVIREGSRPIIAEVESLVSRSFTPYPTRIGEALKREQLATLLSILEQRGGIPLYDKNVVVKTTGGIRLREPSASLAVIMSIASSVYNRPLPPDTAFIADVGLTGELKKTPALESRAKELDRMGFARVCVPRGTAASLRLSTPMRLEIVEYATLQQLIADFFGKKE